MTRRQPAHGLARIRPHFVLREFRRRLAGDLPERVRKRRHAGIAEIGGELLDRDIGLHRQFFDRRRDARALAPALEAQLRLRRRTAATASAPRSRPCAPASRSRATPVGSPSTISAARRQRGSCGSGMKVAESSACVQFEQRQPDQQPGAVGIVAAVEQRQDRLMQQPRHPHHDIPRRGSRCGRSRASHARSKYSVRISISASTSIECSSSAGTQTARSGGTSQRPFGVVTCIVPLAA